MEAWESLGISNDDFIRTTEPRHHRAVQRFLQTIHDNGFTELGVYAGLYCVSCEDYKKESELIDGNCPIHGTPVELLEEENYFFKLSAFEGRLLEWYEANPDAVRPASKRNEALGIIKGGLEDISITRTSTRWGVDVPWDSAHVFYVWYDALGQLPDRHRLRRRPGSVRGVVAGRAPPAGQGHHPLPLRVVARYVHGGGDRSPRPLARPRMVALVGREDVEVEGQPDRAAPAHRRLRRRRRAVLPAARHAARGRRGLLLRGHHGPLQRGPGQQPREPHGTRGHRGRFEVCGRGARS